MGKRFAFQVRSVVGKMFYEMLADKGQNADSKNLNIITVIKNGKT